MLSSSLYDYFKCYFAVFNKFGSIIICFTYKSFFLVNDFLTFIPKPGNNLVLSLLFSVRWTPKFLNEA